MAREDKNKTTEQVETEVSAVLEEKQAPNLEPVIFDFSNNTEPKSTTSTGTGRGRARRFPITKADLQAAFGMLTIGAWALNRPDFALKEEEVNELADAWYEVIKEYPEVGHLMLQGRKVTVWGRALLVTYKVVAGKVITNVNAPTTRAEQSTEQSAVQTETRSAQSDSWENWIGQNNVSETPIEPEELRTGS